MLVVLIDALWKGFVTQETTPFIASASESSHSSPLEPVLGYSASIRATAFSGVSPSVHGIWGKFVFDPSSSPYRKATRLSFIDRLPGSLTRRSIRFALSRTILDSLMEAPSGTHLSLENVPIRILPLLGFHGDEALALGATSAPTIFDLLDQEALSWTYLNVPYFPSWRHRRDCLRGLTESEVLFVYVGGLDFAAHRAGRDVERLQDAISRIDRFVRWIFRVARRIWGDDYEWLIFSDHGVETVRRFLSPQDLKRTLEDGSTGPLIFFDSTMARIWIPNEGLDLNGLQRLSQYGHLLTPEEKVRYGVDFRDSRYGDEIFLLNPGTVFYPSYVSWLKPAGMHGYRPDIDSQLATLVSSVSCNESSDHMHQMVDIMGLIAQGVGIHGRSSPTSPRSE